MIHQDSQTMSKQEGEERYCVETEAMVAIYGMSDKIGLLNFGQNDASSQFYKPYSHSERDSTLSSFARKQCDMRRSNGTDDRQRDAGSSGPAV